MIIFLPALALLWIAAGAITLAAVVDVSHIDPHPITREVGWCVDDRIKAYGLQRRPRAAGRFDAPPLPDWLAYELAGEAVARWLSTALIPPAPVAPTAWPRPALQLIRGGLLELPMFDSPRFPDPAPFDVTAELTAVPA